MKIRKKGEGGIRRIKLEGRREEARAKEGVGNDMRD